MNAPLDTLAFADRFEAVGFGHDQARVLASAFVQAQELAREELVTKGYLDTKLAEFRVEMIQALADQNMSLTRAIGENGKDISNRLWSTITIIAGVATAVSATISAGVALLLKAGGI